MLRYTLLKIFFLSLFRKNIFLLRKFTPREFLIFHSFLRKNKTDQFKIYNIYMYLSQIWKKFCAQSLVKIATIRNTQREQKIGMRGGCYLIRKSAGDTARPREEKESKSVATELITIRENRTIHLATGVSSPSLS